MTAIVETIPYYTGTEIALIHDFDQAGGVWGWAITNAIQRPVYSQRQTCLEEAIEYIQQARRGQAIQKPARIYTFRQERMQHYPAVTLIKIAAATKPGHSAQVTVRSLKLSTYNRFVALANTARYRVVFLPGDEIAWEMWVTA